MSASQVRQCESAVFGLAKELFRLNRSGIARRSTVGLVRRAARALFSSAAVAALEERYAAAATAERLAGLLGRLRALLFPGGALRSAAAAPAEGEAAAARRRLSERLPAVLPPAIAALVGAQTAESGALHFFEFVQCPVLLRSLLHALLDMLWAELFPGMADCVHGLKTLRKDR